MEILRVKIGRMLKELRGERTLFEIASKTGIMPNHISRIERGFVNVSLDLLEKLINYYEVDISFTTRDGGKDTKN